MAHYDSADLLARCKLYAQRPSTDASMSDANWYSLLTEAQEHWYEQFAVHCPWAIMTAPTLLTSADDNVTYDFPDDADTNPIVPMHVTIFETENGRMLIPCTYWDSGGDYVWEGSHIRFPGNVAKTFSSGPYARFITPPAAIAAGSAPSLQPIRARKLIVYNAVAKWARRGGFRDPKPYDEEETKAWYGDPARGILGLLGELKMANPFAGMESMTGYDISPYQMIDTGSGYPTP